MEKIVVFGAGNIGRSLVGQLFSKAGYEVVFVDIDEKIVQELNRQKRYKIIVKDKHPETIVVENVRAVNIGDFEKVIDEILSADIMATSVGVNNLQGIYPVIAAGIKERVNLGKGPIDIIICENVRNSPSLFREGLLNYLPEGVPLDSVVGLIETVIGKMVPIMSEEEKRKDPLLIYAEAYNKLILDAEAFKNGIPKVQGIEPKKNIAAYVDQKLFVHNMGHSAAAYLGYATNPEMKYVWEAIKDSHIHECVEGAMWESGRALILEYPYEFNEGNMKEHIENLIERFGNRALGDTIYRVGRDLPRKLSRNDRLVGALLLDEKQNVPSPCTIMATVTAMFFRGKDEDGHLFPRDKEFAEKSFPLGVDFILKEICGLSETQDSDLINKIKKTYLRIVKNLRNWYTELSKEIF